MEPVRVHEYDDLPPLYLRLKDQDNDCYMDLSAATTIVTAKFREKNTATVLETVVCTKIQGGYHGLVRMDWPSDALDLDYGNYEFEISVAFDSAIQTANRYYWSGDADDDDDTLPVKVVEDFG